MITKPRLSFWQIWNMSFGFLGIQFGFALQNANVSRIFQTMGADVENLAIYWLAAPTTGLIIQPIIGYMSDRTWSRIGRRRPYFLVGAILASLALLVMPNSPHLWVAVGMLWILDASINISMEPFRALVADMLPDEQRTLGFAVQSFFIGTGAVIASLLPYILSEYFKISNEGTPENPIPETVELSFYLGAFAYITAVVWTVIKTREYPPEDFKQFYPAESEEHSGFMAGVREFLQDFANIPSTMIRLAFVQFFSWLALFAMWIYTTPAVTSHIFGATDTTSQAYNDGANWVGNMFAVYNGFSAIIAFLLPVLAAKTSRKTVHTICLAIGGLGLMSIFYATDKNTLIFSMLGVGIAWASILSMPYAILAGALPENKMGIYMGIFNFFIVIPQITAAAILGYIVKTVFNNEPIYALVIGGASMFVAAALVMIVQDHEKGNKETLSYK
jgi:maltose/moltooligosaccharide transporter